MANLPGKLCIIDEEVSSQTFLPDMVLKKISENKTLTANPKNRPTFEFKNTAIPVFAANHWPKTKDLSLGLRRRSLVFEFNRIFEEHEQDRTLGQRIIETELSGVLSQALKGFRRLRQRGNWSIPLSCEVAKKSWLTNANSLSLFIDTMVDQGVKGSKVRFGELYSTYKLWCIENGFKHQMTKPSFRKNVLALGLEIRNGAKNVVFVFDVALKKDEYND
jgi:putative DNA primase/helicase